MTVEEKLKFYEETIKHCHHSLKILHTAIVGTRFEIEYGSINLDRNEIVNRGEAYEAILEQAMQRTNDALFGEGSV